jgi:hypothetical protein
MAVDCEAEWRLNAAARGGFLIGGGVDGDVG